MRGDGTGCPVDRVGGMAPCPLWKVPQFDLDRVGASLLVRPCFGCLQDRRRTALELFEPCQKFGFPIGEHGQFDAVESLDLGHSSCDQSLGICGVLLSLFCTNGVRLVGGILNDRLGCDARLFQDDFGILTRLGEDASGFSDVVVGACEPFVELCQALGEVVSFFLHRRGLCGEFGLELGQPVPFFGQPASLALVLFEEPFAFLMRFVPDSGGLLFGMGDDGFCRMPCCRLQRLDARLITQGFGRRKFEDQGGGGIGDVWRRLAAQADGYGDDGVGVRWVGHTNSQLRSNLSSIGTL